MEVTESTSDGLKRELKVVIAAQELNDRLSSRLDEIKGNVQLKGFRPGKVPVAHLRKIYGRSVMAEVVQQAVAESSQKAMADRDEQPVVDPDISMTEDQGEIEKVISGEADLAYTMKFEVLPEITLTDLKKLKIERPVVEVTSDEVDRAIDRLVMDRTTYEEKEGAAADGDEVIVDFEGTIDGLKFDGGKADDAPIVLGSKMFIPGFEDGLLGAKAGEERRLEITFPKDYASEHLAGKDALFEVKIKRVGSPQRPEVDDEFSKSMGFESLEAMRKEVEKRLDEELRSVSRTWAKRELLDALDETHSFEVPQSLFDLEFDAIWKKINDELEQAGRSFEDEGTTEDEERKRYEALAERRVRLGLVLSEIGKEAEIKVTDDEVNSALMERVRQFPGQEQQVYEFYQKNPHALADLRAPIFEEKVVDYALELAEVTDKKVSRKELLTRPDDDDEL